MQIMFVTMSVFAFTIAGCKPRDVTVSEATIEIVTENVGFGAIAESGDLVTITYRVSLPEGRVLLRDDRFTFRLGAGAVIAGVDDAVIGMRTGGKRIARCPPNKHWGRAGHGDGAVPPNVELTLEIRLISVEKERSSEFVRGRE